MQAMKLHIVYLLVAVAIILYLPVAEGETGRLSASKTTYNLLVGTPGDSITIVYSGTASPPPGAAACNVTASTVSDFGLTPILERVECDESTGYVSVKVSFEGAYNGKEGLYNPIPSVTVKYYDANGTEIGSTRLPAEPIRLNRVSVTVSIRSNSSSLRYAYTPSSPRIGSVVRIFTVGAATLSIQFSEPPDASTTLLLEVSQPLMDPIHKTVYVPAGAAYVTTSIWLDESTQVEYKITSPDGTMVIAQGRLDATGSSMDNVVIVIGKPYASRNPDAKTDNVYAPIYVSKITSGSLTVSVTVDERYYESMVITEPGLYTIEVGNVTAGTHTGTYNIVYSSRYGTVSLNVSFTASSFEVSTGGVISSIYYYTFIAIIAAAFTSTLAGFILRRPDLMSAGLLGMASSVLVFMIPTLMGVAIRLLVESGVSQPAGVNLADVNMFNLGEKVDASISLTVRKAFDYAKQLRQVAGTLLLLVGALAGLSAGVGAVGWLTAGALSQFIGRVAGEFGVQLILLSTYSFFASYMLEVVALIYPVVLNAILVIMFFSVLLYAMFSAYTGNIGQVYGPIIQFSMLVLTVMLVPLILSTIDRIQNEYGTIPLPFPLNQAAESIPNPFLWIATSIVELTILVVVMYMAFNRLVSLLSGGGG